MGWSLILYTMVVVGVKLIYMVYMTARKAAKEAKIIYERRQKLKNDLSAGIKQKVLNIQKRKFGSKLREIGAKGNL